MVKINKSLLPIKAHYFFFMAAMGPILPQITVFGKELGVSADVMGYITSVLPVLYVLAKPGVGFLVDYFSSLRKAVFMLIIITMTLCFAGFYFIPQESHKIDLDGQFNFSILIRDLDKCNEETVSHKSLCRTTREIQCRNDFNNITTLYLSPVENLHNNLSVFKDTSNNTFHLCVNTNPSTEFTDLKHHNLSCRPSKESLPECVYNTSVFWMYVILMCIGTIGFNVTNCISDAICFDVLGESQEMKYGNQRVWGTIGFGLSALLAGVTVNMSTTDTIKSFTPALVIMLVFSGMDLLSTCTLKLPKLSSDSVFDDVMGLLRQPRVAIFLMFATIAGILDSFIIYFMFWHLEDVAEKTGYMGSIKLIEGCVVAAECLCGEIPIFLLSGKILNKLGYVHCMSLCFFTYSIRLGLISLIPNPWWLVGIELVMQGCTYALCYTCIVAYASTIAPPGTSATVQGLVAGMDDGLGFAIGSLIGGHAMKNFGGQRSFQFFSLAAFITGVLHVLVRPASKHETHTAKQPGYVIPSEQLTKQNQKDIDD